jgi:hypothetical protein
VEYPSEICVDSGALIVGEATSFGGGVDACSWF